MMNGSRVETEPKFEVTPEALTAAGQSCAALSTAIVGLVTREGMDEEIRELVDQLRLTSKSIRWLIREGRQSVPSGGFEKLDTKGIKLDKDSAVCQFVADYLKEGGRRAMDVINMAVAAGYTKNEVFKTKELLKIETTEKRFGKWWSLPSTEPQTQETKN